MNPVDSSSMLNFLHWVAMNKCEISSLDTLNEEDFLNLVEEYLSNGEKNFLNRRDLDEWRSAHNYIFKGKGDWGGYDRVRNFLSQFGIKTN